MLKKEVTDGEAKEINGTSGSRVMAQFESFKKTLINFVKGIQLLNFYSSPCVCDYFSIALEVCGDAFKCFGIVSYLFFDQFLSLTQSHFIIVQKKNSLPIIQPSF